MDGYGKKIQQAARLDRSDTTSFPPANIDDGDMDFYVGNGPRLCENSLKLA